MRLLVDTNVYLDLILKRESGYISSLKFFDWCRKNRNQNYITSMSLRDIEYIAHKTFHDKEKSHKVLADIYTISTKVLGISSDSAISAIYDDFIDFEDELLIQTAKENLLDGIVTNNKKDFLNCGVPVFSPEQIISLY